jgi:hypothetical protein
VRHGLDAPPSLLLSRLVSFDVGILMVVAVVHQRHHAEGQRDRGAAEGVLHLGGVGAILHPHALVQSRIAQDKRPHR